MVDHALDTADRWKPECGAQVGEYRQKRRSPTDWPGFAHSMIDVGDQAKWLNALLASAMRCVFSRFWIVDPVLL